MAGLKDVPQTLEKPDLVYIAPGEHVEDWDRVGRRLWEANFDDSQAYCSFYFGRRFGDCAALFLGDRSMIHINPYRLWFQEKEQIGAYVVGVCTGKSYRKRGYMRCLLTDCMERLYRKQLPFVYLMPADTSIYEPFGFRSFYRVNRYRGDLQQMVMEVQKRQSLGENFHVGGRLARVTEYEELSLKEKQCFLEFVQRRLSEKVQCFVDRDEDYYDLRAEEMRACQGALLTFWGDGSGPGRQNPAVGSAMLLLEDGVEISEFIVEEGWEYFVLRELQQYLNERGESEADIWETRFLPSFSGEADWMLMGRIIKLERFFSILQPPRSERTCVYLDVEDGWIPDNQGLWRLEVDSGNCVLSRVEHEEIPNGVNVQKTTVEEIFCHAFQNMEFYLNEMV